MEIASATGKVGLELQTKPPMNNTAKSSLLVLLVAGILALTGCNTAHGFGKDVEKTGEKIQEKTK